jgi:hypothetical protein
MIQYFHSIIKSNRKKNFSPTVFYGNQQIYLFSPTQCVFNSKQSCEIMRKKRAALSAALFGGFIIQPTVNKKQRD